MYPDGRVIWLDCIFIVVVNDGRLVDTGGSARWNIDWVGGAKGRPRCEYRLKGTFNLRPLYLYLMDYLLRTSWAVEIGFCARTWGSSNRSFSSKLFQSLWDVRRGT